MNASIATSWNAFWNVAPLALSVTGPSPVAPEVPEVPVAPSSFFLQPVVRERAAASATAVWSKPKLFMGMPRP